MTVKKGKIKRNPAITTREKEELEQKGRERESICREVTHASRHVTCKITP